MLGVARVAGHESDGESIKRNHYSKYYPASPVQTIFESHQGLDKGKSFFIEKFQLTHADWMTELEKPPFCNEMMDMHNGC